MRVAADPTTVQYFHHGALCDKLVPMDSNTNTTVTFAHRTRANQLVRELRTNRRFNDARILESAIMWESFPNLHSAEQLALANALLRAEYGTGEWFSIGFGIYNIINN